MTKLLKEYIETNEFKLGTAGFITEDGTFLYANETEDFYHGGFEKDILAKKYPEFSNTHPEEDTCIRIWKEPTKEQYERLEEIIDRYLDIEEYCKVEINNDFYKVFSLRKNACQYDYEDEIIGNWTGYKLIRIIKNYFNNINESIEKTNFNNSYAKHVYEINDNVISFDTEEDRMLTEELLLELNRGQLINKSKASDKYTSKDKENENRWTRRNKSHIATRVDQYNKINMNDFFKKDELKVGINVHGETNDYVVLIRYNGVLAEIAQQIKRNNNKLEFKCILIALQRVFNSGNVFVSCSCLHSSTKIRLLDGTIPTIEQMKDRFDKGEELWVYSTDSQGDFKPGKVENVWITKTTTDFIEVTLDNNKKIITTPDHLYMLRTGEYIQAKDLKENDSLMSMYFNSSNGYETINFELNHKVINVKHITLEETPVYDISVKDWSNFVVDSGVVLHNCPDWKYRQAYHSTRDGYNSGAPEMRASDITNPGDSKGAGCKHVNLVLGNVDWLMKVASVINNYIHYMEKMFERKYADIIFPKLFGIPYEKAVQLNLFDTDDELQDDEEEISLSNRYGRVRTRFSSEQPVNNQKNFGKKPNIEKDPNQPKLDLNMTRKEQEIKDRLTSKNGQVDNQEIKVEGDK